MRKTLSKQKLIKNIVIAGLALTLGVGVLSVAQQVAKENMIKELNAKSKNIVYQDAQVEVKKVTGVVVGFSPRFDPKYIGIALSGDNTDYYFTISQDLKVLHKNSLSEIEIGDTVELTFDRIQGVTSKGRQQTEKRVNTVKFIRPKSSGGVLISN